MVRDGSRTGSETVTDRAIGAAGCRVLRPARIIRLAAHQLVDQRRQSHMSSFQNSANAMKNAAAMAK